MGAHSTSRRLIQLTLLIVAAAGIVVILVEMDQILATLDQANWDKLPGAILVTLGAYAAMSLSFAMVGRLLGLRLDWREMALIGFVTNAINHVVTTGGLAGYSLRYLLLKRHGVSFRDVFALTALHFYLTSLDMLIMFPVGIAYLMRHAQLTQQVVTLLGLASFVLASAAALVALLIFSHRFRQRLFRLLIPLAARFVNRDLRGQLHQLDGTMSRGVLAVRRSPRQLFGVMALTWLDWLGSAVVLSFCLDAFGPAVPFGAVVTGFVLGVVAGILSMIPGGLGVQEGSMTGVLTLLGVPFSQAILAAILFRAVFFFLPYLLSLGSTHWLLRPGPLTDSAAAD